MTLTAFNQLDPLPDGLTLLEASAGTGKTYAITTLALRFVAERGLTLDRLLIVTFTRLATGELRERVRSRFVGAELVLARVLGGGDPPTDEVFAHLAAGSTAEVEERLARIRRALADFDAATITTTHGFCQKVLDGLGVAGDLGRGFTLTEDLRQLVEEIAQDLYVARFRDGVDVELTWKDAQSVVRAAVENPESMLAPAAPAAGTAAEVRVDLARGAREEFERRKRASGLLTYDDLLGRLHLTLTREPGGAACRARLAERYDVVLIDEFQDTDPLQWEIVRLGFGTQTRVLIGDPKQAIYAFRGADVHAYLRASGQAGTARTLATSWRSDEGLLRGLDALFGNARLGDPRITYAPVAAAPPHLHGRIAGPEDCAPLRFRVARADAGLIQTGSRGRLLKDSAEQHVAEDLAAQVVALLTAPARVPDRDAGEGAMRPLRPGGIGVLTHTHTRSVRVRDALAAVGVPAVISGTGSVFSGTAATDWLRLLAALERPADQGRASAAALTVFLGWDAERLAGCGEDDRERLHAKLHAWRGVLDQRGVAALTEAVTRGEDLAARALARDDGERILTDVRHIGQLLHARAVEAQLGVSPLLDWLAENIRTASDDRDEERSRRLDSDSDAVQVLTIHRSKGLEFDVVLLPYLWCAGRVEVSIPHIHDPDGSDARILDVGGSGDPDFGDHKTLAEQEQRAEELRLAYVALTRAKHQVVAWWVGHDDAPKSPLGRLLVDRAPDGSIGAQVSKADDDRAMALFESLRATAPAGCISVSETAAPPGVTYLAAPPATADLALARLDRTVDETWGRHSYSGLTDHAYHDRVGSEPEDPHREDEPVADDEAEDVVAPAVPTDPLPMGDLPAGTAFGSVVHAVLERADFAAPDLDAELRVLVAEASPRDWDDDLRGRLAASLGLAIETPLGPALGDIALRDLTRVDRRDELAFELPLVGGDRPSGEVGLADIATLLEQHLDTDDPLAAYPARLRAIGSGWLRGYMVGAIDLVLRVAGPDGDRFAIVDYKTNRLGDPAGPALADYHPDRLVEEMQGANYVLQALLYQVALHRYLRWRLPGYDPARHLGGAHYLFLRGMTGPDQPRDGDRPYGVLSWRPAPALITGLSDLLDRGMVTA